jgi:hypothetical protein
MGVEYVALVLLYHLKGAKSNSSTGDKVTFVRGLSGIFYIGITLLLQHAGITEYMLA